MTTITYLSDVQGLNGLKVVKNQNEDTAAQSASDAARAQYEKQREQFMQVLLTQLENQNPLSPVDPSEFTGQLAQFSSLEQLLTLNENFDALKEAFEVNSNASAFSYIGKAAEINTNMSALQDGQATWDYTLAGDAKDVTITVRDANNQKVYELTSQGLSRGSYQLDFDAIDSAIDLAEGQVLYLNVQALDANGNTVKVNTKTTVAIDGLETDGGETYLRAGELIFSFDDITKVKTIPTPTPPPTTV